MKVGNMNIAFKSQLHDISLITNTGKQYNIQAFNCLPYNHSIV